MWRWGPCALAPTQPDFQSGPRPFPPSHTYSIPEAHFSWLLGCFSGNGPLLRCFLPGTLPSPKLGIGINLRAPGTLGSTPLGSWLHGPCNGELGSAVPFLLSFCLYLQGSPSSPSTPFSTQLTPWPGVSGVADGWPMAVVGESIQPPRSVSRRFPGDRRALGGGVATPGPKQVTAPHSHSSWWP